MKSKIIFGFSIVTLIIALVCGGYVFYLFTSEDVKSDDQDALNDSEALTLIYVNNTNQGLVSYPDEFNHFIEEKLDILSNVYDEIEDREGTFYFKIREYIDNPTENSIATSSYFGKDESNYVVVISSTIAEGFESNKLFVSSEYVNGTRRDYLYGGSHVPNDTAEFYYKDQILPRLAYYDSYFEEVVNIISSNNNYINDGRIYDDYFVIENINYKIYISMDTDFAYTIVTPEEFDLEQGDVESIAIGVSEDDKVKIPDE